MDPTANFEYYPSQQQRFGTPPSSSPAVSPSPQQQQQPQQQQSPQQSPQSPQRQTQVAYASDTYLTEGFGRHFSALATCQRKLQEEQREVTQQQQ